MNFNRHFLGYSPNQTFYFPPEDSKESYLDNLKNQPDDWYYRHNPVSYTYNEFGHRSKSIDDIDLDNYILFTGCSLTVGTGLALEDTYSYLVADELNIDYYNLALGGSGIDILTYNLITWINYTKKQPKALVIQWPEYTRFALLGEYGMLPQLSASYPDNHDVVKFMILGEQLDYFASRKHLNYRLISTLYDCKIINVGFEGEKPLDADVRLYIKDHARDLSHPGIESHKKLSNEILAYIR